jgi:hypothetical protein
MIGHGISPIQQELDSCGDLVPRDQDTSTWFIETAVTDGMTGGYEAGETITASHHDITIGNVVKGPGASLPVLIAEELGSYTCRVLLRETQHLKKDSHLRFHFSRGDPLDEFGFRLAYVDMGCLAEESGNRAEVIEMVMCNEEIGTSQVQTKFCDCLFHYFVAVRISHTRIDYEIPVGTDYHIGVHVSDFRDWYLDDNPEKPRSNFADQFGLS